MESFRQQKSPAATNTFLGLFSQPPQSATSSSAACDELAEDDIFWTEAELETETETETASYPSSIPSQNPNPNPKPNPSRNRYPERNLGLLAALPEEEKKPSSSARTIPTIPKQNGRIFHQSAPVNVPIVQIKKMRDWEEVGDDRSDDFEDEEMLPPHEIVARAASKESPLTTFSMLEGVGRTLKGRDLRKVRNAVWRQTGFLD